MVYNQFTTIVVKLSVVSKIGNRMISTKMDRNNPDLMKAKSRRRESFNKLTRMSSDALKKEFLKKYKGCKTEAQAREVRKLYSSANFQLFITIYLAPWFSYTRAQLDEFDPNNKYWIASIKRDMAGQVMVNKTQEWSFMIFEDIFLYKHTLYGIAKPRGWGKSSEVLALLIWLLAYERYQYVLFASNTITEAQAKLQDLRFELEGNDLLLSDFPHLAEPAMFGKSKTQMNWTQSRMIFKGEKPMCVEVLTSGKGRGKRFNSVRPQVIVLDDVEDEEMADSQSSRYKLERWMRKVILPMGNGGCSIIYLGTIFHDESLMSKIVRGDFKGFKAKRFPAIGDDGKSLWPKIYPIERLEDFRVQMGSIAFEAEFQNNPVDPENQVFPLDGISSNAFTIDVYRKRYKRTKPVLFIDPAQTGKGDYIAMIVVDLQRPDIYVLDGVVKRLRTSEIFDRAKNLIEKWDIDIAAMESNSQQHLAWDLKNKFKIPFMAIPSTGNKLNRIIQNLSPAFDTGNLRFRKDWEQVYPELITQMMGITKAGSKGHDDGPDALASAVMLAKRYSMKPVSLTMSGDW